MRELDEQFCQSVSALDLGPLMRRFAWLENGRPPPARTWVCHAFLAKSSHQFPTPEALLDALQSRPRRHRLGGRESAGDAPPSHAFSRGLGPGPIIDPHPRGG